MHTTKDLWENTPGTLHQDHQPMMEAEKGKFQQPCPTHPWSAKENFLKRTEKQAVKLVNIPCSTTYDADELVATLGKKLENNLRSA